MKREGLAGAGSPQPRGEIASDQPDGDGKLPCSEGHQVLRPVAGPPPAAGAHLDLHRLRQPLLQPAHQALLLAMWKVRDIPQCTLV